MLKHLKILVKPLQLVCNIIILLTPKVQPFIRPMILKVRYVVELLNVYTAISINIEAKAGL